MRRVSEAGDWSPASLARHSAGNLVTDFSGNLERTNESEFRNCGAFTVRFYEILQQSKPSDKREGLANNVQSRFESNT